jgi:Double-GTPase 1
MSERRTVLVIGGPEAGKSNYIFRFWVALRDGKHRDIMQDRLPDEAEYLTAGAGTQLGGSFAGHTPEGTGAICEIPIKARGVPASLIVPDRPGEEWMRIYADRRWPSEWEALIDAGTSCLVFIRANSPLNQAPLDWISVQRFYGHNGANLDGSPQVSSKGPPTQVVAVEWLQMLAALFRKRVGPRHRPRIGIVVSAWDVLSDDDREAGPLGYLNRDFRLLMIFTKDLQRRDLRAGRSW